MLKKYHTLFCVILFSISQVIFSCNKPDDDTPEDPLRVSVDVASYIIIPSASFECQLIVLSPMPSKGVEIVAEVKGEINGRSYYFSPRIQSTESTTKINLNFIPRQEICVCTIKVKSKGNQTNQAEASFRLAYK